MKLKKIRKSRRYGKWLIRLVGGYFVLGYLFAWSQGLIGRQYAPEHRQNASHTDYSLPGTQWIPWGTTSCGFVEPPVWLLGNQGADDEVNIIDGKRYPKPIPRSGEWQVSLVQIKKSWPFYLPYISFTFFHIHFRLGCRWDDVDHYYVFPSAALRRVNC